MRRLFLGMLAAAVLLALALMFSDYMLIEDPSRVTIIKPIAYPTATALPAE